MADQFVLPSGTVITASGEQAERYRTKGWAKDKPAPKSEKKPAKSQKKSE